MFQRILCAILISHGLLSAQQVPTASSQDPPAAEPPPLLDTGIPGPIADGTPAVLAPLPEPLQFTVKRTLTSRRQVTEAPEIPGLPPVKGTINVTEGDTTDKECMDLFQGMHDLYRVEGARMAAACQAREIAYEARRAYLLANPPVPKDVTIRFWKRDRSDKTPQIPNSNPETTP
jgi:hypothetical protein